MFNLMFFAAICIRMNEEINKPVSNDMGEKGMSFRAMQLHLQQPVDIWDRKSFSRDYMIRCPVGLEFGGDNASFEEQRKDLGTEPRMRIQNIYDWETNATRTSRAPTTHTRASMLPPPARPSVSPRIRLFLFPFCQCTTTPGPAPASQTKNNLLRDKVPYLEDIYEQGTKAT